MFGVVEVDGRWQRDDSLLKSTSIFQLRLGGVDCRGDDRIGIELFLRPALEGIEDGVGAGAKVREIALDFLFCLLFLMFLGLTSGFYRQPVIEAILAQFQSPFCQVVRQFSYGLIRPREGIFGLNKSI